jgi:hypothetical protein
MAQQFIEVTEAVDGKSVKVLIGTDWIKAVFPVGDLVAIVVGDGYYNQQNVDDQVERYVVAESYDQIRAALIGDK